MARILLLSGPVAVGKTTVADALVADGYRKIRSGPYLAAKAAALGRGSDRKALQELGDELDAESDYRWLVDEVAVPAIESYGSDASWLVDSVRKARQVGHFRDRFGESVLHLHLTAPESLLIDRYNQRMKEGREYLGNTAYDIAIQHPNEVSARSLVAIADLVFEMDKVAYTDIATTIRSMK